MTYLRRKGKGPTYIRMGAASLYTSEALDAYVLACTHVSSVSAQPIETVTEETDHV